MNKFVILILFFLISVFTFSQVEYTSNNKKAIKCFEKAIDYADKRQDDKALAELKKSIKEDSMFIEPYLMIADILASQANLIEEIKYLEKAISIDSAFFLNAYFSLGEAYLYTGNYSNAKICFETFLSIPRMTVKLKRKSKKNLVTCQFAISAMENPVPFFPVNLGKNINSKYDDYMPSLSADEQTMIFTSRIPVDSTVYPSGRNHFGNRSQEDFFVSKWQDTTWLPSRNLGTPMNTAGNEGAQSLSADGQHCFFTACQRDDSHGSCDIYYSRKLRRGWSKPINLGPPVNSRYWDTQPSISADGRTLYFVSSRPGGKGGMDIWKARLNDDGSFSKPENLGDSINTYGNESAPFIHPDGHTLYFTSDTWPGMGSYDLFMSKMGIDGQWKTPKNLGYPINTYNDEDFLIVNAKGDQAYFAAERHDSRGLDLYKFDLYEEIQPFQVTYVKGKVRDFETNQPLYASFELFDLETSKLMTRSVSNNYDGEFLLCLPVDKNYALNVSAKGYLFYSENFSLKNLEDPSKPFLIDIALKPIKEGEIVVLKNIFFETDKYNLKEESVSELTKVMDFMNENPSVRVELSGHTDNVGTAGYNQLLSENRAKSVYDYLVEKGISSQRLEYVGYGLTKPVKTNDTEEGRAANRRTEFKIIN